ncbi:MAG: metal-dependent hydrolase [Alphaproteobacteria bacterium]
MADFATHLGWGAVGAGLAATATYAADIVPAAEIITLTTAGVVGSVLPDIDLEKAIPSRMLFTGLGLLLAFITLFNFRASYSIAELWLIWLGVYLSMRFGAFHIFHRTAKHRGIFHSLIAGVFFMIFTAVVLSHGLHREPVVAWMGSFGSALKLFDYKALGVSAAMLAAALLLTPVSPPAQEFARIMKPSQVTAFFQARLFPQNGWFKPRSAQADESAEANVGADADARADADRQPTATPGGAPASVKSGEHASSDDATTTATP